MRTLLTAAVLLALLGSPVLADGPQVGTIDGKVVDAQGGPIPGVTVTLSGSRGQQTKITGQDGTYRFNLLQANNYKVTASLEGMGSAEALAILGTGERRTINLSLGATAETIVVTAEAALVDKYQVGGVSTLESKVAETLSFKGRNYQSSVEALPGVVHDATSRFQADIKFAINGGQDTESAGFVDGVDTSFLRFGGSPRAAVPNSALQEVSLEDAGFGAEYGRAVSGVTNAVVKSGTNEFHGQFLYTPQSQKWRAAYDFAPELPRDSSIIDSFETNIGGPIQRDKVWFFASYSEINTNQVDLLNDGSVTDISFKSDVSVGKLNLQPNQRNYFTLLYLDSPISKNHANVRTGDQFAICACDLPGDIFTATWAFTVSPSAFLEIKAAAQENGVERSAINPRQIDPNASPHSPLGNNFSYNDRRGNILYNTIGQAAGEGFITIPRDQANAALSLFRGDHELKFGIDYQDVEQEALSIIGFRFNGTGYNPNLPGGFQSPEFLDVYDPAAPTTSTNEVLSAYAQDRLNVGDKWVLNLGLRYDEQHQDQDVGIETVDWTNVAPRLAVTYDTHADGKLLLKGTLGRYYQAHPNEYSARLFGSLPNGRNLLNRFRWNPATQLYDIFDRRVTPADANAIQQVDPYYKDELTLGVAWQFSDIWVFEATAITWELGDLYMATEQFDANGVPFLDVRTWDSAPFRAERNYDGLRLGLNRAFRDNWTLNVNYTLSKADGNNYGGNDNVVNWEDDLFEGLGGVELGTGATDATIVNRYGRGFLDRTHILNIVAVRQFRIGDHSVSVGGYYGFRSGERWGFRQNTALVHPVSGQRINSRSYREPRDAQQLEDTSTLNLTAHWDFPIRGNFQGRVGVEAANITDEQELIGINRANQRPIPGAAAYQIPREYRFQIGLTF